MKPTTDRTALAAALEDDGLTPYTADEQAQRLIGLLADRGWHLAPDLALPSSVPAGDPRTAPERIDDLNDRQWAVWWLLSYRGPLTDDELAEQYSGTMVWDRQRERHFLPKQTPQSMRTRRCELVRAGHVEPVLGPDGKQERRPTKAGGTAGVWRVASDALGVRSAA